ncbi:DEAD/DEAH box helicase [Thermosynechococcus sp. B0]|uniref:DEAD/DEAH box helicase n=1 Tax=unclassified Thermosynechococcus TaxID=2622553 RepID=UPI00122DD4E7|nr:MULTISPECIES: DEAD/DEAH box helicase [unclassified Thermosynechococcus]QEP99969.1 DEAD/DEAH box helicase [Thermosynechococcus sp. CL-1]WJI24161.1 DEAD/DEAH box helicase [Thermosynechococcus sp. B0]WJI26674.1 DEAD/DEAH box helicase [Thermosynechococcus sp. B1]WJI29202.1 DEAD/DEAH box helicase [Thermosynechococcus sp. B3]WKT83794.1 DEAD/DEAH box helicase [Thermosynechococcus sp. HY596]
MSERSPALADFLAQLPFELDAFQEAAIAALDAGRSVVVCAPTGSGKTLIGEYAIHRALTRQQRVFYTTPLKALSNQKWRDFQQQFGAEQVGLLTGDVSINRDAPILVMTTEIFRNMLYGTPIGEVGTSLAGVEVVVLDECHYMNDRQRGTVWEESIIYCPKEIQLVALSATIANGEQLTDWIQSVHGDAELIYSDWRPIPLHFYFCNGKGLFPLLDGQRKRLNPKLHGQPELRRRGGKRDFLNIRYVVSQLQQREMLPAIYFIFSRRGCDQAVQEVLGMNLLTKAEQQALAARVEAFLAQHQDIVAPEMIAPLYQGIAAHHAGVLPVVKTLVETLFQEGLIKLVFATETLAAGINMPARTTVISTLSKRTDSGHRLLTASEFLQMAGRAGRRGMDTVGHVVTLQTPFEGAHEAAFLATAAPDPLISQFTPSYGMVLNLLQRHTLEEARELVECSFGQYLATLQLTPQRQAIAQLETELQTVQQRLTGIDRQQLAQYQKLRERLRQDQRLLKILEQQAEQERAQELLPFMMAVPPGTWLHIKSPLRDHPPLAAILCQPVAGSGQLPHWLCLAADGRFRVVDIDDILAVYPDRPPCSNLPPPPEAMKLRLGESYPCNEANHYLGTLPDLPPVLAAPEVAAQAAKIADLEAKLTQLQASLPQNVHSLLRLVRREERLQTELRDRQHKLQQQSQRHWEQFLALIAALQDFGGLNDLTPTPLGEMAAALRGENELWLALALASGEFDDLPPHLLAAAIAALVTETPRSDCWCNYPIASEVEERLAALSPIRRRLFQVQRRHHIIFPLWYEWDLIGLVEQWALGTPWNELCTETNLDAGDIVRLLRRTLDFLSQIPHAPHTSPQLRQSAQQARYLLDRFPVNDLLEEVELEAATV